MQFIRVLPHESIPPRALGGTGRLAKRAVDALLTVEPNLEEVDLVEQRLERPNGQK